MVTVQCGSASDAGGLAGSVQPLILSNPLCWAHHAAAAFSASDRVAAVNSLQYFAFFNTSGDNLAHQVVTDPLLERHLQNLVYPLIVLTSRKPAGAIHWGLAAA